MNLNMSRKAIGLGITDYLLKPVIVQRLQTVLQKLTLFGVLINGTIVSMSSWWTRIGVGVLTLIFIGIQSLFYMRKKHS